MNPVASFSVVDRAAAAPMTVVAIEDVAQLTDFVPAWESLAADALEPNVFYEPWMLLPALRAYGLRKTFRFLFVFETDDRARPRGQLLCGFFPLERHSKYQQLPVATLSLWQHPHCYLGTPLLRAGFGDAVLAAVFDWLDTDSRSCPLLELGLIPSEGPFHQLLVDHLNERVTFLAQSWTRALLKPLQSAEAYLQTAVSGTLRRALKRKKKRLAEIGALSCRTLAPNDDLASWLEDFLRLEASGWKGAQGTALASSGADRGFFTTIAAEAFRRNRLAMIALSLGGQTVASRCSFLAHPGSFAFKSAFAEDFAAFSPGVLLEVENIHDVHARPSLRWMDSCTSPDNAMINRLWHDRRALQTLVVATGKKPGRLALSLVPLLRWLKQALRPAGGRTKTKEISR
jgi:CelD/BcsL family acetyltransferase involved in cellulose biosynthesis